MIIKTDRSRIADYEKCPALRFWRYEYEGRGLEGRQDLKLDARIGTWVHEGIEAWLSGVRALGTTPRAAAIVAAESFLDECKSIVDWTQLDDEGKFRITEGGEIVKALVYAWCRVRGESLLADNDILAIEQELDVDFPVGTETVRMMTRADVIVKRKFDESVFVRNIKTVRSPNTTWREQWALDMSTLSEPLAVDRWLGRDRCAGVCIDGLITGEVLEYPKGSGHFYHNTPLLYAWFRGGDPPVSEDEWYQRYEWSCTRPHKLGNGRKCDGGRTHKLSGVVKESVEKRYPGGIIGWIDFLYENDRALLEEQLIELPPIMRSEYHIERWKRQVLGREVKIAGESRLMQFVRASKIDEPVEPGDPATFSQTLDYKFPMHTASGNCLRPGKCMAYDLCWGNAASDPTNLGYKYRTPNHPQEEGDDHGRSRGSSIGTTGATGTAPDGPGARPEDEAP